MIPDRNLQPLFRLIALVLVTAAVASFMLYSDTKTLARIDSLSPDAFIHYILFLVGGGLFLGSIETVVYLLSLCAPSRQPVA